MHANLKVRLIRSDRAVASPGIERFMYHLNNKKDPVPNFFV